MRSRGRQLGSKSRSCGFRLESNTPMISSRIWRRRWILRGRTHPTTIPRLKRRTWRRRYEERQKLTGSPNPVQKDRWLRAVGYGFLAELATVLTIILIVQVYTRVVTS